MDVGRNADRRCPATEIGVLGIEEELFIESAKVSEHFGADEQETSGHELHRYEHTRTLMKPTVGAAIADTEHQQEAPEQAGETSGVAWIDVEIPKARHAAQDCVRPRTFGDLENSVDATWLHRDIGVDQE